MTRLVFFVSIHTPNSEPQAIVGALFITSRSPWSSLVNHSIIFAADHNVGNFFVLRIQDQYKSRNDINCCPIRNPRNVAFLRSTV